MGMINFPDKGYEDSGEGGLFVMLVAIRPMTEEGYPDISKWDDHCHVDVHITLPSPDVCVSDARRDMWEPYDCRSSGTDRMFEVGKILEKEKRPELMQWVYGTRSHLDESVELLAALHLDSTCLSLCSEKKYGGYFDAGYDDLTDKGRAIYDALKAAYGIEPTLLTFLDT